MTTFESTPPDAIVATPNLSRIAQEHIRARRRNRLFWLIPLGLFVLAALLYTNLYRAELFYSWDDNRYIRENLFLRDFSVQGIVNIFTNVHFAAYIPVTLFSYWIEFRFFGFDGAGYHIVGILLNAINTVLVFYFLRRMLGKPWVALGAAILFAIHPVQVEGVAWVAERKNQLSFLFTLGAFMFHMRALAPDRKPFDRVMTWVLFLVAALAKPVVVGVPIVFILYEYWQISDPFADLGVKIRSLVVIGLRNIIPVIIGIATAVAIILAHDSGGGLKEFRGGSPIITAGIMLIVFLDYAVSLVAPFNLNNRYFYPVEWVQNGDLRIIGGILLLVFMAWFAWKQPLGKPFSRLAILWIVVLMLPVINIVPINIERADRYLYFPNVVIFALVMLAAERLWHWNRAPQNASRARSNAAQAGLRFVLSGVAGVIIVVLAITTVQRSAVWVDEGTLWRDHLVDYPRSETGLLNLGVFYFNKQDFNASRTTFETLTDYYPNHFKGNRFLGRIAVNENRYADAISYYLKALTINPNDGSSLYYLGQSYFNLNDYTNAAVYYQRAFALGSNYATEGYINYGTAALNISDFEQATEAFNAAQARNRNNALVASGLCAAQANLDQFEAALENCLLSVELAPTNGFYLGRAADVFMQAGQPTRALEFAQQGAAASPRLPINYRVMGQAFEALGEPDRALTSYQQALQNQSNNRLALEGVARLSGQQANKRFLGAYQ